MSTLDGQCECELEPGLDTRPQSSRCQHGGRNTERTPNSGCGTETEGDEGQGGRPGGGATLTCHDSHVAVAVAERLHQGGNVGQEPQAGPLAEARGHFLPLGQVQVLNFTGQTHQLWGGGGATGGGQIR